MSKSRKQKQQYTKEYKLGAVKLITVPKYSYAEAGRSLPGQSLYKYLIYN